MSSEISVSNANDNIEFNDTYILSELQIYSNRVPRSLEPISFTRFKLKPNVRFDYNEDDSEENNSIKIYHSGATELENVGLQVWRGALLLGDFLLYMSETRFCADHPIYSSQMEMEIWRNTSNFTVIEIGAGTGLVSIAASKCDSLFRNILVTDYSEHIIKNARKNLETCSKLQRKKIKFKLLDLHQGLNVFDEEFYIDNQLWSVEDRKLVDSSSILWGADVIYDTNLTISLVSFTNQFLKRSKQRVAYFSVERRFNFTKNLEIACSAMEVFLSECRGYKLNVSTIPLKLIPQKFEYERCTELIILRVTL